MDFKKNEITELYYTVTNLVFLQITTRETYEPTESWVCSSNRKHKDCIWNYYRKTSWKIVT